MQELIELEEQGWRALSTEGDAGRKFYASVLREDAVMLFSGGMRIVGRERILQSLGAQSWGFFILRTQLSFRLHPTRRLLCTR